MKQFAIRLFPFQYTSHTMSINSVFLILLVTRNSHIPSVPGAL